MRFVLASALFGYGINKVFALQFPEPGLQRLTQDYGDSSPMGLMWTFMGASAPYTMFAGSHSHLPWTAPVLFADHVRAFMADRYHDAGRAPRQA